MKGEKNAQEQAKLVKKAMKGDKRAFEELIRRKNRDILYFAVYLSNATDGKDIAQEAIIQIFRYLPTLKQPEAFDRWMLRIVRNAKIDFVRRSIKENIMPAEIDIENADELYETRREFLPEAYVRDGENRKLLMDLIHTLPDNYKECIFLFYYENQSYRQIAEILGVNEKKVANDLVRAKALLKKKLEGKTGRSFTFSVLPIGMVPALTQLMQGDAAATVTPELLEQVLLGVEGQVISLKGLSAAVARTGALLSETVKGALACTLVTLTLAGSAYGVIHNFYPAAMEQGAIITVEDMIGTRPAMALYAFEKSAASPEDWADFLEETGAKRSARAQGSGREYVLYVIEKQDKQLLLMEERGNGADQVSVKYRFGEAQDIPPMVELMIWFDGV